MSDYGSCADNGHPTGTFNADGGDVAYCHCWLKLPAPVRFSAVNRQGRKTCGTSHLIRADLVADLTAMGWTDIQVTP